MRFSIRHMITYVTSLLNPSAKSKCVFKGGKNVYGTLLGYSGEELEERI